MYGSRISIYEKNDSGNKDVSIQKKLNLKFLQLWRYFVYNLSTASEMGIYRPYCGRNPHRETEPADMWFMPLRRIREQRAVKVYLREEVLILGKRAGGFFTVTKQGVC